MARSVVLKTEMASGYEPPSMSLNPSRPAPALDDLFWLAGDEECGVGINCRKCDRGGAPIAYYTHPDDRVYQDTDVKVVHTIAALISAAEEHAAVHT